MGGPASLVYRRGSRSSLSLASLVDPSTEIDAATLAAWVVRAPPTALDRTPYKGIRIEHVTVPPRVVRGPSPSRAQAPDFLRRALIAAVDASLVGVRRVAVLAGGGIDSSALLAIATRWAKRTGGSAFAVSLDFEGRGDDRPHLRALEAHLQCEVVRVQPEEAAHRISLLASGADGVPVTHPVSPMMAEMLARARAHGAERVLCGAGADELLGGSPQALVEIALRGHPVRAMRAARRLAGFDLPRAPTWSWLVRPLVGRALPTTLRAWRDRRDHRYVAPDWAGPVLRSYFEEQRRLAGVNVRVPPRTERERFAAISEDPFRTVYAWERLQHEHAGGVDLWWPYQDLDLAAAVAALPPDYLLFGDRWRGLFRESLRDLVPDSLREREDKAFFEPALRRFVDAAGGLESLRPIARMRELGSLGLVDRSAFAAAFERFVAAPDDGEAWVLLWPVLAVEAFLGATHGAASVAAVERRAS
jgi:asparagine synthetase B (glutamine-hydrolysing)